MCGSGCSDNASAVVHEAKVSQIICTVWDVIITLKKTFNTKKVLFSCNPPISSFSPWLTAALHGGLSFEKTVGTTGKPFHASWWNISAASCRAVSKLPEKFLTHVLLDSQFASKPASARFFSGFWDELSADYKAQSCSDLTLKCVYILDRFLYSEPDSLSFPQHPLLSGLVCHMSDPHCGLHPDHWPPASPLSLPSAPRLGLFGQGPNVDWLNTCLSMLSGESPHRLLKP